MQISFGSQINNPQYPLSNEVFARNIYKDFLSPSKPIYNADVFVRNFDSLNYALNALSELTFDESDIKKVKRYGVTPVFNNGQEALKLAQDNKIKIAFAKVSNPDVHAQWVNAENKIIINERYKNTRNLAEIYAISAAIFHELSHAKDKDDNSSIQEEINCLGMNALAFNVFKKKNPELFKGQNAPIIEDGVELYSNLFLGDDERALVSRINLKYGDLAHSSIKHPISDFVKKHFSNANKANQEKIPTKSDL